MKSIGVALFAVLVLAACATSYQPMGFTGGYEETQYAPDVWQVDFRGNGYTSRQRVQDFAMLRAADLTLQSGAKYFVIISAAGYSSIGSYTTPTTSTTTGNVNFYGNSAYGSSTTTTYGGQTYTYSKAAVQLQIKTFTGKPGPEVTAALFDAAFLSNSIRHKYNIDQQQ